MFRHLIDQLKAQPRTIVFADGPDPRILESTDRLLRDGFLKPILIGKSEIFQEEAEKGGFSLKGAQILDPESYEEMDVMVDTMVELRKGKMSREECAALLKRSNYFATMLVKLGKADCLLGGATYSTADTVRPALQLVKTKPGNKLVTSCFVMRREKDGKEERMLMGDCSINIDPTEDELVELCVEMAKCAKRFGVDPKVAFISYSTKGSGKGASVEKMRRACEKAKALLPDTAIDGEMQFDAAISPAVGQLKFPGSKVAGQANTFVMANIDAGNVCQKIMQWMGSFDSYGPILMGLNAPINDLSRGCTADEVYYMAIITASLA